MSDYCQLDEEERAERMRLQDERRRQERRDALERAKTAHTVERQHSIAYREPACEDDRSGREVRPAQRRDYARPAKPDPRKMQARVRVRVK